MTTGHNALATEQPSRFRALFPATLRGVHRVRHAAEEWLGAHLPSGGDLPSIAALLLAELAANAALHRRVRGRGARLTLFLGADSFRIEVTDGRGERMPTPRADMDGESGRGLGLVQALADDLGVRPHHPGGKTVWAELRRHHTDHPCEQSQWPCSLSGAGRARMA